MGLSELKSDAKSLIGMLTAMSGDQIDLKAQLIDNVLPLMIGICEAVQEDIEVPLDNLEEAVDQLIDQDGDVLLPETAEQFLKLIELGKLLAKELTAVIPKLDDVGKKRVRAKIIGFGQQTQVVTEIIAEITLPLEPDKDEAPQAPEEPAGDAAEGEPDEGAEGDEESDEDDEADVVEGG